MSDVFGDGGADAATNAAKAKQDEARRQFGMVKDLTDQATVSGIAQFEKDIANSEKNLSRQEQLISQLDPTIIEASQQALRLLKGEDASTLGPLKAQRDRQRQKLMNSLRAQLGPGAETSTAGMQALTMFDSETDQLFAGAQQQALGNLGNISSQFSSQRPDMFREIMGRSQFGQGKSNLLFNQAGILQGAGQNLIDTAGAEWTGDVIKGQQNRAFNMKLFDAAVQGGAMALGAPPGAAPKMSGGGSSGGPSMGQNLMTGLGFTRKDQYQKGGNFSNE